MSLNICEVGTGFEHIPPEGAWAVERVIHYLCKEFVARDNCVHLFDIHYENRLAEPYEVSEIIPHFKSNNGLGHIMRGLSFGFSVSDRLSQRIRKKGTDIVHFHNQFSGFFSLRRKIIERSNSIYTVHNPNWALSDRCSSPSLRTKYRLEIMCLKRAKNIIAVSDVIRKNLIKYFMIPPQKITMIHNGVDTSVFSPSDKKNPLRSQVAPNGQKIILCVGRISRYKNQRGVLNAISLLQKEINDFKVIFIGPISDTTHYNELNAIVKKNDLDEFVVFTGSIPEEKLHNYYQICDIFLLPSITEGLPLALLEAMSSGVTVVASNIAPHREIIQGGSGFLVDPNDPKCISEMLSGLLTDQRTLTETGKMARKHMVDRYDWKVIAEKTLNYFEEVIQ